MNNEFVPLLTQSVGYSLAGVVLGVIVNSLNVQFVDKNFAEPYSRLAIKLTVVVGALALIQTYLASGFAQEWQETTAGFIFLSMFLNSQSSLFVDLGSLSKMKVF